ERFWRGVVKAGPDECWEWKGGTIKTRGSLYNPNGSRLPYRIYYEMYYGPIPDGMCVCHRCDNGHCCNPAHLFLGTHQDNMADMMQKGRHRPSKFSKEQVIEIRNRVANGEMQTDIAKELNVNLNTINGMV